MFLMLHFGRAQVGGEDMEMAVPNYQKHDLSDEKDLCESAKRTYAIDGTA